MTAASATCRALLFRPARLDLQDLRQLGDEQLDQVRIEMPTTFRTQQLDGCLYRPGFLVGTLAGQGIEYIGNCHDTPLNGNRLALQAMGIATAIPFFVMTQGNVVGHA